MIDRQQAQEDYLKMLQEEYNSNTTVDELDKSSDVDYPEYPSSEDEED